MSRLSKLFHREKSEVLERAVMYLDGITNISGEEKAKIVTQIMKTLHVGTGGVWDAAAARAVDGAIDYVLATIRGWTKYHDLGQVPVPVVPPVEASIYNNFASMPYQSDEVLISQGYKAGDVIWVYDDHTTYIIERSGSVPPLQTDSGAKLETNPPHIIGG